MKTVTSKAKAAGKFIGSGLGANPEFAQVLIGCGVQWLQAGNDFEYMIQGCHRTFDLIRAGPALKKPLHGTMQRAKCKASCVLVVQASGLHQTLVGIRDGCTTKRRVFLTLILGRSIRSEFARGNRLTSAFARSWEGEPPCEPRQHRARSEPRPPRITQVRSSRPSSSSAFCEGQENKAKS